MIAGIDLRSGNAPAAGTAEGRVVTALRYTARASLAVGVAARRIRAPVGHDGGLIWDARVPARARWSDAVAVAGDLGLIGGGRMASTIRALHGHRRARVGDVSRRHPARRARARGGPRWRVAAQAARAAAPPVPLLAFALARRAASSASALEPAEAGAARPEPSKPETVSAGDRMSAVGLVSTSDGGSLVATDASGTKLLVHELSAAASGGSGFFSSSRLRSIPIPSIPSGAHARVLPLSLPHCVAVAYEAEGRETTLLLRLLEDGRSLDVVKELSAAPGSCHLTSAAGREGGATVALLELQGASSLSLSTLQLGADGSPASWSAPEVLPYDEDSFGALSNVWLSSYARKDGSLGARLLMSSVEHSLQLVQAGKEGAKAGWVRQEALASIHAAEMVPLPALIVDKDDDDANGRPSFAFALPAVVGRSRGASRGNSLGPAARNSGPPPNPRTRTGCRSSSPPPSPASSSASPLRRLHPLVAPAARSIRRRAAAHAVPLHVPARRGAGDRSGEEGEGAAASTARHGRRQRQAAQPGRQGRPLRRRRVLHAAKLSGGPLLRTARCARR